VCVYVYSHIAGNAKRPFSFKNLKVQREN